MSGIVVRTLSDHKNIDHAYNIGDTLSQEDKMSAEKVLFMTGNLSKYTELTACCGDQLNLFEMKPFDIPEIQHIDPLTIVTEKCRFAYERLLANNNRGCIMVEDVSLSFNAFGGLPGPYIKWFVELMKLDDIHRMLGNFKDKSATAQCVYALMDRPDRIVFCRGHVSGNIVAPRGDNGFGWDALFEDNELGLTYAEMDSATKKTRSHRAKAVDALKAYMNQNALNRQQPKATYELAC
ncbi:Inosine triphosphate pyrophosphatase [Fragariocoptes setiger]|uniref:Inosine triphosphate pyrophosphatase n=1 Tax=Fragariocoptes setiger TaxID=1670756 RepID=A0ABQ7S4U1_9ACAR|nr:Inosine triphosphate pyrophosphatase [Fragariocoptes setiger]